MYNRYLISNIQIVNEGEVFVGNVLIGQEKILAVIRGELTEGNEYQSFEKIDGKGMYLFPGVIDDHVHFREPGLTQKGDIYSESKAAVAGGVTSFMDMPNTIPAATSLEILEDKFSIASEKSFANYSFYLGATTGNAAEIRKVDTGRVCGLKLFLGSSTGNLLVSDERTLAEIFAESPLTIAAHCEDDALIKKNLDYYKGIYGAELNVKHHPLIRSAEACYKSSARAVELAVKYQARLHLLHLTTAKETGLLGNTISPAQKKITGEVCIHHLAFTDEDYESTSNFLKVNPAIKTKNDRDALFEAMLNNKIDVIATDHAPHLKDEKTAKYADAPSGAPMIQHSLPMMLEFYHKKMIPLEKIVEKMCHSPAEIFGIKRRGFIREGYYADLIIADLHQETTVSRSSIFYKCGWSPLEGFRFHSSIVATFVNGKPVFYKGEFDENARGKPLVFNK